MINLIQVHTVLLKLSGSSVSQIKCFFSLEKQSYPQQSTHQHLAVKYTNISAGRGMNIHTSRINKFMSIPVKFLDPEIMRKQLWPCNKISIRYISKKSFIPMILDKQAEEVPSSVEERKWPSGQTHKAANLLLQGDLYCKATNETKKG